MLVLITDSKQTGQLLVPFLRERGILLFHCSTENGVFYCEKKDTGGVLIDLSASRARGESICRALHAQYPALPIALICSPTSSSVPDEIPRDITRIPLQASEQLCRDALDFCRNRCGWNTAPLSAAALYMDHALGSTVYMGYPLHLPPRAFAILYCLLYRSPYLTSTDDLMMLCFPEGRQRVANLAVQIRRINRIAATVDPRPLIVNVYGKGYRLRDGVV